MREIVVEDNRIASQRVPNRSVAGSSEGHTINTARLNLDSTGAYAVASHTAETSHVTFSLVSYTLRTDDRGNPTWIVTLEDRSRRPVGTIHIKANDGRVSRVEGMYQGRNMEQVEEDSGQVDNRRGRRGRRSRGQRRETTISSGSSGKPRRTRAGCLIRFAARLPTSSHPVKTRRRGE